MTGTLIAPVIPSPAAARPARAPAAARTLPLTAPPVRPPALGRDVVYGRARVDRSGRVADRVPFENRIRLLACGLVVASGGVGVFVDQAVEDGFSADLPDAGIGNGGPGSIASGIGDALGDALVRPGGVVVNLVLA